MRQIAWQTLLAVIIWVLGGTGRAKAEPPLPPDDLMRLVPAEVGAAVLLSDLGHAGRDFFASQTVQRFQTLPAVEEWKTSPAFRNFVLPQKMIEHRTRMPFERAMEEIFGEAVVLALRPPTDDQPAVSLFLTRARCAASLERVDAEPPKNHRRFGERRTFPYRGETIVERTIRPRRRGAPFDAAHGPEIREYSAHLGRLLALSNQREMVERVIDLAQAGDGRASLAGLPAYTRVRQRLPEHPLGLAFIVPRAWDSKVQPLLGGLADKRQELSDSLRRAWNGIEAVGLALEVAPLLVLHADVQLDPACLPSRLWRERRSGLGKLAERAPADALAVLNARLDVPALDAGMETFLEHAERRKWALLRQALGGMMFGRDVRSGVEPLLGPDAVLYSVLSAEGTPQFLGAVELQHDKEMPPLPRALDNLIRTLAALSVLDVPPEPAAEAKPSVPLLEDTTRAGIRITCLRRESDKDCFLAYTVAENSVVVASASEPIAAFLKGTGPRLAAAAPFRGLRASYFPRAEDFLYLNTNRLSRFLDEHRKDLGARIMRQDRIEPADAEQRLNTLIGLTGLFRAGFAAYSPDPASRSLRFTIGLVPAEPVADQP